MSNPRVDAIQAMLQQAGLAGWLLYDFRRSNILAYRILQLPQAGIASRRWFYWLPASGAPIKIVSALEQGNLDTLPGEKIVYRSWRDLHDALQAVLPTRGQVAMEYSPMAAIPVVARVDAGTIELIQSFGVEVVSSADLVQAFEARLSPEQWASHQAASAHLLAAKKAVARHMGDALRAGQAISECSVQAWLDEFMQGRGVVQGGHGAIVAVNAHASNPHYSPDPARDTPIRLGDLVLIDFVTKLDQPGAIMADYTWMFYAGSQVPDKMAQIFAIDARARDAAIAFIRERIGAGAPIYGYEVDDVARGLITDAGYGDYFVHRTGHNIGEDTHGNGVNIDNLETQDQRQLIPGVLFSIEPGIYLPEFGVRTEVNVYIGHDRTVTVTGELPQAIEPLL